MNEVLRNPKTGTKDLSINGKFLTTAEVCLELGKAEPDGKIKSITEGRVRQLVKDGQLTPQKFGRENAFDAAEVARLKTKRNGRNPKGGRPPKSR